MTKNYRIIFALLFGPLALLMTGCATVTRGTTDTVHIDTDPSGADIRLSNGMVCTTPCNLEIKRNAHDVDVAIELAGYHSEKTMLESKIAGGGVAGVAGNAIIGGVVGIIIDSATGAMLDIHPNPLIVEMVPETEPKPDAPKLVYSEKVIEQAESVTVEEAD